MSATDNVLAQLGLPPGPAPVVVVTQLQGLPLTKLRWEDFEKLCLRLALLDHEVEDARRYGVPGQQQGGIDLYARQVRTGEYAAYQCKKVHRFKASDISAAIDIFLAGPWAGKAARFVICSSVSFAPTQLADRIETERRRLAKRGVTLDVWDADALNIQLKKYPTLVEDFFGSHALAVFCGRVPSFPLESQTTSRASARVTRKLDAQGQANASRPVKVKDINKVAQQSANSNESGQDRADHLLSEALNAAHSVTDARSQASALTRIATWMRSHDPDRAIRIIDDAERIARAASPEDEQVLALTDIANTVLLDETDRAIRLIEDAAILAQAIPDGFSRESALTAVAAAMAIIDPGRAESLARSIPRDGVQGVALAGVAKRLALVDLDRAEDLAQSITNPSWKDMALADIVLTAAYADVDRAERIAHTINDQYDKITALAHLARAVADKDSDRAHRLAAEAEELTKSIASIRRKITALTHVAWAVVSSDPQRAERLLDEAQRATRSIDDACDRTWPMTSIAETLAILDPKRAERIARSICCGEWRVNALARVAEAIALSDPDRAVKMARSIPNGSLKAHALTQILQALDEAGRQGLVTSPEQCKAVNTNTPAAPSATSL